ncbi:MAG: hypothetical protein LBT71_10475 [Azoarcus sp.]|jgi:hypothetical protein|nr:hypothetical protein [Azoarcus sp.]
MGLSGQDGLYALIRQFCKVSPHLSSLCQRNCFAQQIPMAERTTVSVTLGFLYDIASFIPRFPEIYCELFIVFFKMNEALQELRKK